MCSTAKGYILELVDNDVLKVDVEFKDALEDLKAQLILSTVKSSIFGKKISGLKYENIAVRIFNKNTNYIFTSGSKLNNEISAVTAWKVSKTEFINDKVIESEAIFEERAK